MKKLSSLNHTYIGLGTNTAIYIQGDHSTDNVKFPDSSRHSSAALGMLSVTHIMPVLVTVSGRGRNATVHDLKPYI